MSDTAREVIARAIMVANVCGFMVEGEQSFCDDARGDPEIRCEKCDCKEAAVAIIAALEVAGFAIVPNEPTEMMCQAGHTAIYDCFSLEPGEGFDDDPSSPCYRAMLLAASQDTKKATDP